MSTDSQRIIQFLKGVLARFRPEDLARFQPRHDPSPPRVPGGATISPAALDDRWSLPGLPPQAREELADAHTIAQSERYCHNIENFIGTVKLPVGLAGPLRVNGLFAHGDFYLPLATTEAALVASYSRGAQLITEAGGCTAALLNEGVSRAPGFAFQNLQECGLFVVWATAQLDEFRRR